MMAEEYTEPPLILSFLFAAVGAGCIAVSVWMMPWTKTLKPQAEESGSVRVETVEEPAASAPVTTSPAEKSNEEAERAQADAAPAAPTAPVVQDSAEQPVKVETPVPAGPWIITLSPDNYSVTAKGWEAIKEIRALFLANPNIKIDIIGNANIMRSKKRATHAAKIVRDRISEGDPNIKWRMTISGVLSEKEVGLSATARVVGGPQ